MGRALERVIAGGDERIQIAEEHEWDVNAGAADQVQQPIERHSQLESALRARLNDWTVCHRVRERQAKFDDIRTRLLEASYQIDRALGVRMSSRDVRNQRAATGGPQLDKTLGDPLARSARGAAAVRRNSPRCGYHSARRFRS